MLTAAILRILSWISFPSSVTSATRTFTKKPSAPVIWWTSWISGMAVSCLPVSTTLFFALVTTVIKATRFRLNFSEFSRTSYPSINPIFSSFRIRSNTADGAMSTCLATSTFGILAFFCRIFSIFKLISSNILDSFKFAKYYSLIGYLSRILFISIRVPSVSIC